MQIVILAAGASTRFMPYCETMSKAELALMGKPLILWTLDNIYSNHLQQNVVVVIAKINLHLKTLLKPYIKKYHLTLAYQDKPQGMADAILSAKPLLDKRFMVFNHSQIQAGTYAQKMSSINTQGVVLGCVKTANPQWYGIVELKGRKAIGLIEKPQIPIDNPHRVLGWLLTSDFIKFMATLPQEEYVLEIALNLYMKNSQVLACVFDDQAPSLKYPWQLLEFKNYLFKQMTKKGISEALGFFGAQDLSEAKERAPKNSNASYQNLISSQAQIAKSAIIKGKVIIKPNASIYDYAIIEGPAYIGEGAVVGQHCIIRKGSVLEAGAQIQRFGDISNSILMPNAHIHSGFIGDSIIGENCQIGAGFITANRRIDRGEIQTQIKGQMVNTHLTSLGTIIGKETKIGIQASTMPGVIISNHCTIGPGVMVKKNINTSTKMY